MRTCAVVTVPSSSIVADAFVVCRCTCWIALGISPHHPGLSLRPTCTRQSINLEPPRVCRTTVSPLRLFFDETVGCGTNSRAYPLNPGTPLYPDVIGREFFTNKHCMNICFSRHPSSCGAAMQHSLKNIAGFLGGYRRISPNTYPKFAAPAWSTTTCRKDIFASIFCIGILLPFPNLPHSPSTFLVIGPSHSQVALQNQSPLCRHRLRFAGCTSNHLMPSSSLSLPFLPPGKTALSHYICANLIGITIAFSS